MAADEGHKMDSGTPPGHCTKVFLHRDYIDGTAIRFQTKFPSELDGRIERSVFEQTINTLNQMYNEAESLGGRTYCESCFACLTAYLAYLCMDTYYEKCLKKINRYIEEQNKNIFVPRGLMLIDPVERGLRVTLYLTIPGTQEESHCLLKTLVGLCVKSLLPKLVKDFVYNESKQF